MVETGDRWRMGRSQRVPWAGSDRRARLPADWSARRHRIWVRDKGLCQWPDVVTGALCRRAGREVDHRARGDNHHESNLWVLCGPHHDAKTQAEAQAARVKLHREPEAHPGLL